MNHCKIYIVVRTELNDSFLFVCVFQVDEIFNVPGTGPVVGGTLER